MSSEGLTANISGTYTDLYQLAMAQTFFLKGNHEKTAVFDYFFRKLPFNGGYAVFAGLDTLIDIIGNLRFTKADLDFLRQRGFNHDFLAYLQDFRFRGTIFSSAEGDIVFPVRPVLQVEGAIAEAQIIETVLLNTLNFQTLIATKASRIKRVAGNRPLSEFGLRRSQATGGYFATRASMIGGFDSTSNVKAGLDLNIPVAGTMAHSFIQSYDDELSAFRDFAAYNPDSCILLVDTYNTLKSGVPNAIRVGLEMLSAGKKLKGIRIDSGDLAYLSRESRRLLDEAGLKHVSIVASNQLDEYVIRSLNEQDARVDSYGVGTSLAAGLPDAALDGVYKLAFADGKPRLKLSESLAKVTLPDRKQVYRVRDINGNLAGADVIALQGEKDIDRMNHPSEDGKFLEFHDHKLENLLHKVMEDGLRIYERKEIRDLRAYSRMRLDELPPEYKRFENPHVYKIGITERLKELLLSMMQKYKNPDS